MTHVRARCRPTPLETLLVGRLHSRHPQLVTLLALIGLVMLLPASALAAGDDAVVGWQLDFNAGFAADPIWPAESVLTSVGGGTSRIDQMCTGGRKWSRSDPTGGSNPALRIFQDGDDSCLTGAATKPKHRAMFRPTELEAKFPYALDEHHWIGYRIYFPKDFASDWLHKNNVTVHHFAYQGEKNIYIAGDAKGPVYEVHNRYTLAPDRPQRVKEKNISMPTGQWIDVVSHVLRKRDNTGILELWIDGVKEVSWHGIRTASDPDATGQDPEGKNTARWKIGLYWGPIDRPVDFTIYLDEMKYAKGKNGYHVVDPSGRSQPPIPDAAPIEPDAAVTEPDAAVPVPDAAVPVTDAAVPVPDAVAPVSDAAALPEADGGASQEPDVTVRVEGCAAAGGLGRDSAGVALMLALLLLGLMARRRGHGARGVGLMALLLALTVGCEDLALTVELADAGATPDARPDDSRRADAAPRPADAATPPPDHGVVVEADSGGPVIEPDMGVGSTDSNGNLPSGEIIYQNNFDRSPLGPYSKDQAKAEFPNVDQVYGRGGAIVEGKEAYAGRSMRIEVYEIANEDPPSLVIKYRLPGGGYDDVYTSFMFTTSPNFDGDTSGKLISLAGSKYTTGKLGTHQGITDPDLCFPDAEFSSKPHLGGNGCHNYTFFFGMKNKCFGGTGFWWDGGDGSTRRSGPVLNLARGTWHHIEFRIKVNTPGKADGILQTWYDGELMLDNRSMQWRKTGEHNVERASLQAFTTGGSEPRERGHYIYYDNYIVSTTRQGPP